MITNRIDTFPTHEYDGYKFREGHPLPFGASLVPGGVNFSVFSTYATACTLVLYERGAERPAVEIPFPPEFRTGNVWAMIVFGLDAETTEYGYRMDGPNEPQNGHRFDPSVVLMDPYARAISGRDQWGAEPDPARSYQHRGRLTLDDFDWGLQEPPRHAPEDLVIYEMHARGFTAHPSSGTRHPGTLSAIREKIPYLKELGINAVELMPIFEFDEWENPRYNPFTRERLKNYWGYSTIGFFAPKAGFAATGALGMQTDELKALVKDLHAHGIEVILDVVYNHTGEGGSDGPLISFRGLDNKTYYMLTPDGYYLNYSGTGNTLNCNHPVVRNFVLDSLRYWVAEYHIDGFRFDLASILGRDPEGVPLKNPPLLESLAYDPILAGAKLIAEAWDAGGLYQVGSFPAYRRWSEWNGRYRDTVRRHLRGDPVAGELAQRMAGSPDLYASRGPTASINFVTCHDGFTLRDLFSYNEKHNEANGELNRDGADDNYSWNHGVEGDSDDPAIEALRLQQMKNAIALLFLSQGIPMILMGDEMGRTQQGNNNAYCHDTPLSWLDWGLLEQYGEHHRFVREMIAFRRRHAGLRQRHFFTGKDVLGVGCPDLSWHGIKPNQPDWSPWARTLAFMICGKHAVDQSLYVAINGWWEPLPFEPPPMKNGKRWHLAIDTARPAPGDIYQPGEEPLLDSKGVSVAARSVLVLLAR